MNEALVISTTSVRGAKKMRHKSAAGMDDFGRQFIKSQLLSPNIYLFISITQKYVGDFLSLFAKNGHVIQNGFCKSALFLFNKSC